MKIWWLVFQINGELLRVFYPNTDYRQFLDFMSIGIKVNDSNIIYLHKDINNEYKQYYTEKTNILNTEIYNSYFKLKILQKDFIPIKKNVLIKRYELKNENLIDLNINFLLYSKLISDINNQVSGLCKQNVLKQYMHDYTFCIFSKNEIGSYQINSTETNIDTGVIEGKDYVGMSSDSSILYDLNVIKPGETKILDIYIYIKENSSKNNFEKIDQDIESILKDDVKKEFDTTKKYWNKYFKDHNTIDFDNISFKFNELTLNSIKKIYERTIMLFPLLINAKTGGISAGIEIDEEKLNCGRYSYCWPRDAIFITEAMDNLNMQKQADKFYNTFCRNTQSKNGMWEQRFYTDGNLAPCWGYQIDETAAVIYGVYNHYLNVKDKQFLKNNLKMCEKALEFLLKYVENDLNIITVSKDAVKNDILNKNVSKNIIKNGILKNDVLNENISENGILKNDVLNENISENGILKNDILNENFSKNDILKNDIAKNEKAQLSYDLWEEREGIHTYSVAAIYSSFVAMKNIYELVLPLFEKNRLKQEKIRKQNLELEKKVLELKEYIIKNFYNSTSKSFVRNNIDLKMDISLLGLVTPFEVFTPEDKKIKNTIDKINLTIRTFTGGYLRYEGDTYGGGNPWVLANLWMAEYYMKDNDLVEAKKCFEFVIKTCSEHGFLGEQVNNLTMKPAWVVGLGWSHAMFINFLKKI